MYSMKPQASKVKIKFTEDLELGMLAKLGEKSVYRDLLLVLQARCNKADNAARSDAALDFGIEVARIYQPLWVPDMIRRGLVEGDEIVGYKKIAPELWAAGQSNALIPYYRRLTEMRGRYDQCRKGGMDKDWRSWEDVAAESQALHDMMKSRCHYYFIMDDLYRASAAAKSTTESLATASASAAAPNSAELGASPPLLKRDLGAAAMADASEQSPKRPRLPQTLFEAANFYLGVTPLYEAETTPSLVSSTSESTASIGSIELGPAPTPAPLADSYGASLAGEARDADDDTILFLLPASFPHASLAPDDYATLGVFEPLRESPPPKAPPKTVRFAEEPLAQLRSLLFGTDELHPDQDGLSECSGLIGIPEADASESPPDSASSRTGGVQPGAMQAGPVLTRTVSTEGLEAQVLWKIDWTKPAYTHALLYVNYTKPQYRSVLIPDRHSLPVSEIPRPAWKVKRDLYVKVIAEQPGEMFLLKLVMWGCVGKVQVGEDFVWKASEKWPNVPEMVYDFGPRLQELQKSWLRGTFTEDHANHFQPPKGAPTWDSMMRFLYGPPGEPVVREMASTNNFFTGPHSVPWLLSPFAFDSPSSRDPPFTTPDYGDPTEASEPTVPHAEVLLEEGEILPSPRQSTPVLDVFGLTPRNPTAWPARHGSWHHPSTAERHRESLDKIHVARDRAFNGSHLSAWRQGDLQRACSAEEQFRVFLVGRAELFVEGLLECIAINRPPKLHHKLSLDLQIKSGTHLTRKMRELALATGSRYLSMQEMRCYQHGRNKPQLRFGIRLQKPAGRPVEDQIRENFGELCVVGLMEYLEYVGRLCGLI